MIIGKEVYKPGICWSIIPASHPRSNHFLPEHLCGGPACLYQVTRPHGYVTMEAWVCLTHRAQMERKGYTFKVSV